MPFSHPRTLDLRMTRQGFFHCATTSAGVVVISSGCSPFSLKKNKNFIFQKSEFFSAKSNIFFSSCARFKKCNYLLPPFNDACLFDCRSLSGFGPTHQLGTPLCVQCQSVVAFSKRFVTRSGFKVDFWLLRHKLKLNFLK